MRTIQDTQLSRSDALAHSAQVTPSLAASFNNLQFGSSISRIEHSASFNHDTARSVFPEAMSEAAGQDAIHQVWLKRQQAPQQQDKIQGQNWMHPQNHGLFQKSQAQSNLITPSLNPEQQSFSYPHVDITDSILNTGIRLSSNSPEQMHQ